MVCDFTYLGITLSDAVSLPLLKVSKCFFKMLLPIYQSLLFANFTKIKSRKILSFYIYTNGAFLKSLSVVNYMGRCGEINSGERFNQYGQNTESPI